jgi:hypothetical protein
MISFAPSLIATGAHTGIAPVSLLDVQDVNGNVYYWSDRKIIAPNAITGLGGISATPPVPVPAGQRVAWALPTEVLHGAYAGAGTSSAGIDSAYLTITESGPFLPVEAWAQWQSFRLPSLPSGAVIEAIYPVVIAFGTDGPNPAVAIADSGPSLAINAQPTDDREVVIFSTTATVENQYSGSTLGNTADAVTTGRIGVCLWNTLPGSGFFQDLTVTFVGIAIYYQWPPVGGGGTGIVPVDQSNSGPYQPWILSVPKFTFNRSLASDTGAFVIQNLSGDTLSRDFERLARLTALEGAFFIYRYFQPDAQASWLEVHGTLTLGTKGVDTVQLNGVQLLNPAQDDTPLEVYCETCQLQWGGPRCGSTETTECQYSFETCQVIERPMMALNNFEKNYGDSSANTSYNVQNRRRKI